MLVALTLGCIGMLCVTSGMIVASFSLLPHELVALLCPAGAVALLTSTALIALIWAPAHKLILELRLASFATLAFLRLPILTLAFASAQLFLCAPPPRNFPR